MWIVILALKISAKKMSNLDEDCALGNEEFCFVLISDVGTSGSYLSLILGTAKFKQLDYSYSLYVLILHSECPS